MTSMHLDLETYQRLRSGSLDPARARELASHLDGDCAVCEAFLASLPPDDLDGAADAALTRVAPLRQEEQGGDLEFWQIRRAMAAAFLLVGGAGLFAVQQQRAARTEWDGVKGRASEAVPARLRFAVVEAGGGATQLDRGQSGAVVPEGASLAFRVEVGRAAHLALLRVGSGESEVVWRHHASAAGAFDVSEHGRPAAYPLRGLAGMQRFVLLASERPIANEDLAAATQAAKGANASHEDPRFNVMTLDVVEVTVR
jgi:hypothetical protein